MISLYHYKVLTLKPNNSIKNVNTRKVNVKINVTISMSKSDKSKLSKNELSFYNKIEKAKNICKDNDKQEECNKIWEEIYKRSMEESKRLQKYNDPEYYEKSKSKSQTQTQKDFDL